MDELERKEEELNSKVCSIFLTPQTDSSMKYFEAFKNGIERKNEMDSPKNTVYHKPISYHHYWKAIEETKESDMGKYKNTEEVASSIVGVYNFLNDILSKESVGLIEPIQDYTKHTIKAFMNFIDSGFKSKKDESVTSKKNYYETIDEIFAIWDINDENKALANKIISELQNENIILAKTESLISIKKQMNICGIFKPPKTIKSSIPCFIKYNSTHSYDSDYKLAKDGFYRVNVNNNNIDKFIQNARDLIGMTNK